MGVHSESKMDQLPPNSVMVAHDLYRRTQLKSDRSVLGFAIDMGGNLATPGNGRSLKIPFGRRSGAHKQTGPDRRYHNRRRQHRSSDSEDPDPEMLSPL